MLSQVLPVYSLGYASPGREDVMVRKAVARFPLEMNCYKWQWLRGNLNPRKDCFVEGKDPESAQDCTSAMERKTEVQLRLQNTLERQQSKAAEKVRKTGFKTHKQGWAQLRERIPF